MQDFPNIEIKGNVNEEKIEEALDGEYIYSSMDMDFLMRDIVRKKGIQKSDKGYLATEIVNNKGQLRGMAELKPNDMGVPELTAD